MSKLELAPETWEVHADRGAELEAKGDGFQWEARDEYLAALADSTVRAVAERVGKSKSHIGYLSTMVDKATAALEGLSFAECYRRVKRPELVPSREPGPLPIGAYRTIVADPPWRYGNSATRGAAEDHYETLTLEAICDLDIPAADDAHLYLWTTNAFLRDAFDVVDAWGFIYKTCLTWVKPQIGMGNYFRNSTEHVLFGLKGKLPTERNDVPTSFEDRRGKHSAKPDSFLDLVETCSPGPYLEMFARRRRMGWDVWGAEA